MRPDIMSGNAIDFLELSCLTKPIPFKPFAFGSEGFAAMIERTK
jgi:hypothetical protein